MSRHASLLMSDPTPQVESDSCRSSRMRLVRAPRNTSTTWCPPRRPPSRYTQDSAFWACSVASYHCGGSKHTSQFPQSWSVSYTHLRAHETKANLVCRLLLEKKKKKKK